MNGHLTNDNKNGIAAKLARPNILELHPYRCARDDYDKGVLLDANENALGPPFNGDDSDKKKDASLERYPDPYQVELKKEWCRFRNAQSNLTEENEIITPAHLFCGVGSDEAIDLLMRIFCQPASADAILTTPPTYGMYKVSAKVNDVQIVNVPLQSDFDLDVSAVTAAITPNIKLLFCCSPGNPTSRAIGLDKLKELARAMQDTGLLVVDEAYVDFSLQEHGSAVTLVRSFPNIVVLQTMSKAFGLAAIRCGFAIAAPDVIQLMNNVKAPYNMNALTSKVALEALQNLPLLQSNVETLLDQRKWLVEHLLKLPFCTRVHPSHANFVLAQFGNDNRKVQELYRLMAEEEGVVTRFRGDQLHCEGCLRITVGTSAENETLLKALQSGWEKVNKN